MATLLTVERTGPSSPQRNIPDPIEDVPLGGTLLYGNSLESRVCLKCPMTKAAFTMQVRGTIVKEDWLECDTELASQLA